MALMSALCKLTLHVAWGSLYDSHTITFEHHFLSPVPCTVSVSASAALPVQCSSWVHKEPIKIVLIYTVTLSSFYYVPCFFLSASYFPSKSSIACYRSLGSAGPVFICMCLCRRTIMTNVQVKSIITLQRPSVPFRIVICRAMLPLLMRVFIFVHASSHPVFSAALLLLPLRFRLQFLLLYLFLGGVTFFVYLYFFFCVLFCFYNVILLIFKGADSKGTTLTLAQVLTKVLQYIQ